METILRELYNRYFAWIRRLLFKLQNLITVARYGYRLPKFVEDDEVIVRAVLTPSHVNAKGTKLRTAAFRPLACTDEVSVMRHLFLGVDDCKSHAKSLEHHPKTKYVGLAVLRAAHVRKVNSDVVDSRFEFLGHADIKHGIVVPPKNEPLDPERNAVLDAKLIYLRDNSNYLPDPDAPLSQWSGPDFEPKPVV